MPDETYVVSDVYEDTVGRDKVPVWQVIYDKPDGTKHQHVIPKMAVNWRVAEYELSVDEGIEFVLYEAWAVDPETEKYGRADPAMRMGMALVTPAGEPDEPVTLFTAETVEDAREAQRARIAEAKQRREVVVRKMPEGARGAAPDPFRVMKATHMVSVEDVEEKRLRVRAIRQGMGLDGDKPSAARKLAAMRDRREPERPLDESLLRRDRERRKDMTDVMYGVPIRPEV